jgi:hypothetical protein
MDNIFENTKEKVAYKSIKVPLALYDRLRVLDKSPSRAIGKLFGLKGKTS